MRAAHLAPALPASLALLVQTVLPAQQATVEPTALQIPAKLLLLLLMMGQTVTSTASTGEMLGEQQAPVLALAVILGFSAKTVIALSTLLTA
jgi:hypothetical protein